MKNLLQSRVSRTVALMLGLLVSANWAGGQVQYVITNNDVAFPGPTSVSFFSVGANGTLTYQQSVLTGGNGIGGGYFGANGSAILNNSSQQCVYASEANDGDISGISLSTFALGGRATGSTTDTGVSNGIGLVMNDNYLYASFTDSSTIGTFQVQPGCSLMFVNDTAVTGLQSGVVNAMAIHGNMLIVTYTDGSIESFNISNGPPVSNGDKQLSSANVTSHGATYPNAIDITSDGHYALFGDTSTSVVVEVSDISSGKLAKTKAYKSTKGISSSNIMLSPDETILYVVNTQGDAVTAFFFNKTTGALTHGCTSNSLAGMSANWSYLASAGLLSLAGNGGGVYVAEFGSTSGMAMVQLTTSGKTCTLKEAAGSPFVDPYSTALLSIRIFPPRSF